MYVLIFSIWLCGADACVLDVNTIDSIPTLERCQGIAKYMEKQNYRLAEKPVCLKYQLLSDRKQLS